MDKKEIEKKVIAVLADRLDINLKKIKINSDLVNDLGVDSFMAVELAYKLREQLSMAVTATDLRPMKTVKDVVNFVIAKTVIKSKKKK